MRTEGLCISILKVASGSRVKRELVCVLFVRLLVLLVLVCVSFLFLLVPGDWLRLVIVALPWTFIFTFFKCDL